MLKELAAFACQVLDEPPNTLSAAGALAVRANGKQARTLAENHLVKAVRWNRRLK